MSHFYDCSQEPFLTKARTPSQAKKLGALPSVTTILSSKKSDFLDNIWTPRKLVELARLHPEASSRDLMEMKYGFRTNPLDGKPISSSEFGWKKGHPFLKFEEKGSPLFDCIQRVSCPLSTLLSHINPSLLGSYPLTLILTLTGRSMQPIFLLFPGAASLAFLSKLVSPWGCRERPGKITGHHRARSNFYG